MMNEMMQDYIKLAKEFFKSRERELRQIRRNKSIELRHLWDFLPKGEHIRFLEYALEDEEVEELIDYLRDTQRAELWNEIPNTLLGDILTQNPAKIRAILKEMSPERKKSFFCCLTNETTKASYYVFMAIEEDSLCIELMEENPEILLEYLKMSVERKDDEFLYRIEDMENFQWIFAQIGKMPEYLIAKLLKLARDSFFAKLEDAIPTQRLKDVYCYIKNEDLWQILEKSRFHLLFREEEFPVKRINQEERKQIVSFGLENKFDFWTLFGAKNMALLYSSLVTEEEKADFLKTFKEPSQYAEMYLCLPEEEQNQMLKFLMMEERYEIVKVILKRTAQEKELTFWERMLYKELRV